MAPPFDVRRLDGKMGCEIERLSAGAMRGLTQEAFAEEAGIKHKHYQAIEAGRKIDFRISTLKKLAKGRGLERWELLHPDAAEAAVADATQAKYGRRRKRRKN